MSTSWKIRQAHRGAPSSWLELCWVWGTKINDQCHCRFMSPRGCGSRTFLAYTTMYCVTDPLSFEFRVFFFKFIYTWCRCRGREGNWVTPLREVQPMMHALFIQWRGAVMTLVRNISQPISWWTHAIRSDADNWLRKWTCIGALWPIICRWHRQTTRSVGTQQTST